MPARKTKEEFNRFTTTIDALLSVPHSEIQRREEEYKQRAAANPRKRGPKPRKHK